MDTKITKQEPPKWVVDRITSLGGLNPFGKPNYKVVWGGNRTYQVGGMFKKILYVKSELIGHPDKAVVTQVAETRTLLKYHPERWHMERWRGPEFYGDRDTWYLSSWDEEAQLHTMGDYPHEGDYEHVFYLGMCTHMTQGDTEWCMLCKASMGEYIPLEPNIHLLEMQINALRMSEDVSRADEQAALFMREGDKRQANRAMIQARVENALRPQWALQPTSWQPGMGAKCSQPEPGQSTLEHVGRGAGISQSNPSEMLRRMRKTN